ncbi:MAG TPA: hypothetical protein VN617_10100 [Rhodoferax sp.]|nr:hypothetical protein [Rhodoferax sp.]
MRLLVLLLVLVNGVYFAWSHDLLRAAGFGPEQQSEPQRLAQQIKPQELRLLNTAPGSRRAAPAAPAAAAPAVPASGAASAPAGPG